MMKSQLEVRPMFHWTEKRVAGDLMISFLAFTVLRGLDPDKFPNLFSTS